MRGEEGAGCRSAFTSRLESSVEIRKGLEVKADSKADDGFCGDS